jgi:hypothetical protein
MAEQHDLRRAYPILVAYASTSFRKVEIDDPVPLGRQILTASGHCAGDEFSLYNIVETGDFEDVCLDEEVDLRRPGAERFIIFKSERDLRCLSRRRIRRSSSFVRAPKLSKSVVATPSI